MKSITVIKLPDFDTGQYEGNELHMRDGDAVLTLHIVEAGVFRLHFKRVRWHRFTATYACPAEWISGSYFSVAKVTESLELQAHLKADSSTVKPYQELHHFRIFLDESGCHEFLAESASAL